MELSIQRLSSQQTPPTSSFCLSSLAATSPLAPQSTPVTPPQQPVKPHASHPGQDKPSPALATSTPTLVTPPRQPDKPPSSRPAQDTSSPSLAASTPTHSQSSCSELRTAIDTPPSSSDGEGKLIHQI